MANALLPLLLLLIHYSAPSSALECPSDLPEYEGTDYSLAISCTPTHLHVTVTVESWNDNNFESNIICINPNETKVLTPLLDRHSLPTDYSVSITHDYPPFTVCWVVGCFYDAFSSINTAETFKNDSCIVLFPTNETLSSSTTHVTSSHTPNPSSLLSTNLAPPLSPSLPHHTITSPTHHTVASFSSQAPTLHSQPMRHKIPTPLLASVTAVCSLMLPSLILLLLLLYFVRWYRSRTHKVLEVGKNNWKTETLDMDYYPLDLRKSIAPAFSFSQESLLNSISVSPAHSLSPASLPLLIHPPTIPSNTPTMQDTHSSIKEPLLESGTSSRRTTKDELWCVEEELFGGSSSGGTSGYSTGCASDNAALESTQTHLPNESLLSGAETQADPAETRKLEMLQERNECSFEPKSFTEDLSRSQDPTCTSSETTQKEESNSLTPAQITEDNSRVAETPPTLLTQSGEAQAIGHECRSLLLPSHCCDVHNPSDDNRSQELMSTSAAAQELCLESGITTPEQGTSRDNGEEETTLGQMTNSHTAPEHLSLVQESIDIIPAQTVTVSTPTASEEHQKAQQIFTSFVVRMNREELNSITHQHNNSGSSSSTSSASAGSGSLIDCAGYLHI